jgi:hypothetical protein
VRGTGRAEPVVGELPYYRHGSFLGGASRSQTFTRNNCHAHH